MKKLLLIRALSVLICISALTFGGCTSELENLDGEESLNSQTRNVKASHVHIQ